MESKSNQPPLVVIVGPTASGKSALGMFLAAYFKGEIISGDSRTVYRDMSIGTAKPTRHEMQKVRHHLINVLDVDQSFTAADFKQAANQAIQTVAANHHLPFLVGGSGLYVDALLYDFQFAPKSDPKERERLQRLSVEGLQDELHARNIPLPHNAKNPRHLVHQIETAGVQPGSKELRDNTLILGIYIDKKQNDLLIRQRIETMIDSGLEAEARALGERYGWNCSALRTIGYQEFQPYFAGDVTFGDTKAAIVKNTIQYAKRQRTWFKRNKSIHWVVTKEEAVDLVTTFLNK